MARDETVEVVWRDVCHSLRRDIDSGKLAPGAELPTIAELARETGLSPHGARRVFDKLRQEGRVQSWQGKGTRVAMQRLRVPVTRVRPTFHELVEAAGRQSRSDLLRATQTCLRGDMASRLNRKPGAKVTVTETLRMVDDRAYALSVDYFPADRFAGMAELVRESGSVSWSLSEHGVNSYRRDRTSFEARLPTAHEALLLDIPRTQPVYATIGANLDPRGDYVQLSTGVLRADCVQFEH